jgi:hypothetical protein
MDYRTRKHRKALIALVPRVPIILSNILERANKQQHKMPDWRVRQLKRFGEQVSIVGADLERARIERRITIIAWNVRNLLELWIWIQFCCVSESNAKRFRDDTQRDFYGMMKAFGKMAQLATGIEDANFTETMDKLRNLGKTHGIENLGDDFKRVSQAAEELGHKEFFLLNNKFLSKLAHPTAFVVHSAGSMKSERDVRDMIFVDGAKYAIDSIRRINNLMATVFRREIVANPEVIRPSP